MANIYDIEQSFLAFWMLLEDDTIEDDVLEDAFDNLQEDLKCKLENCCKYIKNEEATIEGLKEEEKRLKARRTAAENRVARLQVLMKNVMNIAGERKLKCGTFAVSVRTNLGSVVLDTEDFSKIPSDYLRYKDPEVNKQKVKEDIKNGKVLDFAHLEPSESIQIR